MAPPRKRRKKNENEAVKTKEAMLTIERLSRKYLNKSPNVSANNRGVVEPSLPSPVLDNISNQDSKQKTFNLSHTKKSKPKRLAKPVPVKTHAKVSTPSKSTNRSSRKKVCEPTPSHSIAMDESTPTESSLLGFEELEDTPTSTPISSHESPPMESGLDSTRSSGESVGKLELSVKHETRPYIVPSRKRLKKQAKFEESEVMKWVADKNREFEEVDDFELIIE